MSRGTAAFAWLAIAGCCLFACLASAFEPPLFVFQNGFRNTTVEQEITILKDNGYAGISSVYPKDLKTRLPAYTAANKRILSVYTGGTITNKGFTCDPLVPEAIELLKDRNAIIELTLRGKAKNADKHAVAFVQEIADLAAKANVRVALYPHAGFYVSTIPTALRIAKLSNRENVGIVFNLCHFLKSENPEELEKTLQSVGPYLFHVSTNGADSDGKTWKQLIQPLDKGNFDQNRLLSTLRTIKYVGALALQCYAVPGKPEENLRRSKKAWQNLIEAQHPTALD